MMNKQQIISIFLFILQNCVSGFGEFGPQHLISYSDPRFLNPNYQFRGLGLFQPHFGSLDKKFDERKQYLNEDYFYTNNGEDLEHGNSGVFKGEEAFNDSKGESESVFNEGGEKKEHVDGKSYFGGEHFGKKEKSRDEQSAKHGHRKGHKIRGFSKSHHNDESGKTEEYYDEAHDEANKDEFEGKSGEFGESGTSHFQGGHLDKGSVAEEVKKSKSFDKGTDSKHIIKEDEHFGENKFGGDGKSFGEQKLLTEGDLVEYSGSSKFWKHHPASYI